MIPSLPLVAITMGDPVGVGPEIIPKALSDPCVFRCCRPVIYGDAGRLQAGAATTGARLQTEEMSSINDTRVGNNSIPVINPAAIDTGGLEWGKPTAASGMAMVAYLNAAIDDAMAGRISAIATGPINKLAMKMADIRFSGHTEILAQRTGTRHYAMMLAGNRLKVVLVTIHIPIEHVPRALTTKGIMNIVTLTDRALKTRFGIPIPRIAVAGLNPHAGESGLFGDEEEKIITPAIGLAASEGINVTGPHPPDTVFFSAAQGAYDVVVAMYHDQGLGPFKMIHFDDGVNTTLGLPIIRTSVDHGTAYDIAGTGKASPESMGAAIIMAAEQSRWLNRERTP
ncbi:MAG: 4-hydroxythreonine-4-phosphate dehydrogenase PdxA [Desulfosarcina sp.]|nr:4-hydroxythreonine-4-phosphate dehydrogenase PdxA [Desulfosarcina sp.]MBC2742482.1 4-hydroxythreonine-4-phosphate dehydrogenase PdxA [Desulfosarcina sp.]MBC2765392.1 4-hydroxythreonine-4-phosphate dehydrogenase PdxA [Desulfosarcina sp.]